LDAIYRACRSEASWLPSAAKETSDFARDTEGEVLLVAVILKAVSGERIIGTVRAKVASGTCTIGRLAVHPDFQGQGIGSALLKNIEASFPDASKYELFTGSRSQANIRLYQRHGYTISHTQAVSPTVSLTFLEKPANPAP